MLATPVKYNIDIACAGLFWRRLRRRAPAENRGSVRRFKHRI